MAYNLEGGTKGESLKCEEVTYGAVGIKDLAIMLDAETEVLDHAFGQVASLIDDQSDRLHVAVPPVHLIKTATRYNERQAT